MPTRDLTSIRSFEHLGTEECWRLVGRHGVGRVGFKTGGDHVRIVPTRYDAHSGTAYFRAPTFGELARSIHGRTASLEVDDLDRSTFTGWSVLMTGVARRVEDPATMASLWSLGRPHPWFPGPETQWIALPVDEIRGQRVGV